MTVALRLPSTAGQAAKRKTSGARPTSSPLHSRPRGLAAPEDPLSLIYRSMNTLPFPVKVFVPSVASTT